MSLLDAIVPSMDQNERKRYRIVRLDTFETVPGVIVEASVKDGTCKLFNETTKDTTNHDFGAYGLRIMPR
jgi:hypothetical protein